MIDRIVIDSSDAYTELCMIGKSTGTDKSPYNVQRHRHPYTAVYTMLLANYKNKHIDFAEIGVAMGSSVMVWDFYFKNPAAKIHMFDCDTDLLERAKELVGERVQFSKMDVSVDGDVARALEESNPGKQYDVILDDSSHNHGHQIRIIKEAFPRLKSGGTLIIEDIFRATDENEYEKELGDILPQCSAAYFVMCEHKYRWSETWNNDKLLVFVKA